MNDEYFEIKTVDGWRPYHECLVAAPRNGVPFEALPKEYQTQEMELAIKSNGHKSKYLKYKYESKYKPKNASEVFWNEGYR